MGGTLVTNAGTTVNPPGGFHYLYGPLTPPEVIGAKTGSFTLSDTGFGTTPTNSLGETGTMAFSSATTVDFTTRMVNFGGVNMSFPSNSWGFSGGNTPIVIVPGKGAFVDQVTTGFCSGGACATSLPAVLGKTGIFMGPNGDHLGLALQARTTSGADVSAQGTKILTCSPSC